MNRRDKSAKERLRVGEEKVFIILLNNAEKGE